MRFATLIDARQRCRDAVTGISNFLLSLLEGAAVRAMVLETLAQLADTSSPLAFSEFDDPIPDDNEILIDVSACGVCHTEIDEIEGRTAPTSLPVIPGHQVVGRVIAHGPEATRFTLGQRVGVAWIFSACGKCIYCLSERENLCPDFKATGRDVHGGYAELMKLHEAFAYPIPETLSDFEAAPLLCAGAIGYRSLRLAGIHNGGRLGLTGFGASGHLVQKLAAQTLPDSKVFVFARSTAEREFASELGAAWVGNTTDPPPERLDAIIDTTPVWKPVVEALGALAPGGRLVINAIRKENGDKDYLLNLDYERHLWLEKDIKSVANVTRKDVSELLSLAAEAGFRPDVEIYPLKEANRALLDLKEKRLRGAKVLEI